MLKAFYLVTSLFSPFISTISPVPALGLMFSSGIPATSMSTLLMPFWVSHSCSYPSAFWCIHCLNSINFSSNPGCDSLTCEFALSLVSGPV